MENLDCASTHQFERCTRRVSSAICQHGGIFLEYLFGQQNSTFGQICQISLKRHLASEWWLNKLLLSTKNFDRDGVWYENEVHFSRYIFITFKYTIHLPKIEVWWPIWFLTKVFTWLQSVYLTSSSDMSNHVKEATLVSDNWAANVDNRRWSAKIWPYRLHDEFRLPFSFVSLFLYLISNFPNLASFDNHSMSLV